MIAMICRIFLLVLIFMSALEVVIARHEIRGLFIQFRVLEKERDSQLEQWGRIQLEQSTWSRRDRIEEIARNQLGMIDPARQYMLLVAK